MAGSTRTAPVIALVGNPNVGKSTVFNALTSLHQHTGNWPGKTVATARGAYTYHERTYTLVDLPGTYSLRPGSAEEEVTRDYLLSGEADVTLVVADATGKVGITEKLHIWMRARFLFYNSICEFIECLLYRDAKRVVHLK